MGFLQRKLMSVDDDCESCIKSSRLCSEVCPPTPSDSGWHIKTSTLYLTITFSVLAAAFLVLCYYVYYVRRSRRLSEARRRSLQPQTTETRDEFLDEDHGPIVDHHIWYINTVGLQPSIIDSIAVFKYKKGGEGLVEGTECSVCLSEFEDDESLRLLPKCSHAFHISCIDTWLRSHTNCPLCRAPIVSNTTANNVGPSSSSSSSEAINTEESEEETRVVIVGDDGGGTSEIRTRPDEEELEELDVENGNGVQPMRRSVSMDSLAASQISHDIIANGNINMNFNPEGSNYNNTDSELAKAKESSLRIVSRRSAGNHQSLLRLMCSSSISKPIFMKRSFSCNGKFSLPIRNTKGRNTNPPLRSF